MVATEYHADTLTDTLASALALLGEAPGLHALAAACWLYGRKIGTRCTRWKAEWKICTFIIGTERRLPPSGGGNS